MFKADTSFPLARHVVGPQNTRTLTVLGWTDDIKILNVTLYPDHVQNNTLEFMTALYNIGRLWLGAATILPPKHIHDHDSPDVPDPDNFSTFRPKCTRYNSPGAYGSRFTSYTSHMKLIICIRKDAAPVEASSLVRTSSSGNCCYWRFKAVIRNASRGSFDTSSYNIAGIFLSGIALSLISFALSINSIRLCTSD